MTDTNTGTPVRRVDGWEVKLHDFVEARASEPFAWGSNDCCLFCADAVEAMTGVDPAEEFRGKYRSQSGSLKAMQSVGAGSVLEAAQYVASKCEMSQLSGVLMAQRGDLVLYEDQVGQALGIVYLNGREVVFVGQDGLYKKPLRECKQAWAVGREL